MLELYLTIVLSILNVVVPYAIVRHDRRRLEPNQLARAWNRPSFACAVYFFGPLSLPAHFWVTRRKPTALLLGAFWAALVLAGEWLVAELLEQVFG
ncbi:MAG TPA: hypothetical protein VK550_33050 [Polyangiaceae bacterium]|nr:hypothetical protein [Polyangiaceae bacterium]